MGSAGTSYELLSGAGGSFAALRSMRPRPSLLSPLRGLVAGRVGGWRKNTGPTAADQGHKR